MDEEEGKCKGDWTFLIPKHLVLSDQDRSSHWI